MAVVTAAQSPRRINPQAPFLLFFLIFYLLCNTSVCYSQPATTIPAAFQNCDILYNQRADLTKCSAAITCYERVFAEAPGDVVAVRLAKSYYWLGAHTNKDEQLEIYQKGIDWSKKAIELNSKNPGGHFWLGVNNGKYGEARGILKSLFLVGPIKDSMQQVISLNPGYEYGGAYRVLGRMYYKLPRFAGGGMDKSIEYLKKSLAYAPNISSTRLFLAESYMAQKNYKQAQQELNAILNTPAIPGLELEFNADKAEAQRLLPEVNKKLKE
jgi:tetratricopeptide (TPR) repeat protein